MGGPSELQTERLLLRRWRETDRAPFAALNRDPQVMEHFPSPHTRERSDEMIAWIESCLERDGFGLWALEVRSSGQFIGFTGLNIPSFDAHFTPAVEVGWRLAREAWGHGYATEAARASLDYGFSHAELDQIVALTTPQNLRSRAVMERLGMTRDPDGDFEHPNIAPGHPLRRHVLYRISARQWKAQQASALY